MAQNWVFPVDKFRQGQAGIFEERANHAMQQLGGDNAPPSTPPDEPPAHLPGGGDQFTPDIPPAEQTPPPAPPPGGGVSYTPPTASGPAIPAPAPSDTVQAQPIIPSLLPQQSSPPPSAPILPQLQQGAQMAMQAAPTIAQTVLNPAQPALDALGLSDLMGRPQQSLFGAVNQIQQGAPIADVGAGALRGLTGQEQHSYGELFQQAYPNTQLSPLARTGLDVVGGLASDPMNLIFPAGEAGLRAAGRLGGRLLDRAVLSALDELPNLARPTANLSTEDMLRAKYGSMADTLAGAAEDDQPRQLSLDDLLAQKEAALNGGANPANPSVDDLLAQKEAALAQGPGGTIEPATPAEGVHPSTDELLAQKEAALQGEPEVSPLERELFDKPEAPAEPAGPQPLTPKEQKQLNDLRTLRKIAELEAREVPQYLSDTPDYGGFTVSVTPEGDKTLTLPKQSSPASSTTKNAATQPSSSAASGTGQPAASGSAGAGAAPPAGGAPPGGAGVPPNPPTAAGGASSPGAPNPATQNLARLPNDAALEEMVTPKDWVKTVLDKLNLPGKGDDVKRALISLVQPQYAATDHVERIGLMNRQLRATGRQIVGQMSDRLAAIPFEAKVNTKTGLVTKGITPNRPGLPMGLADIAEHPNDYTMSANTRQWFDTYDALKRYMAQLAQDNGAPIPDDWITGDRHFPRHTTNVRGVDLEGRTNSFKERTFASQQEGIDNGIQYKGSPMDIAQSHLQWLMDQAVTARTENLVQPLGVWGRSGSQFIDGAPFGKPGTNVAVRQLQNPQIGGEYRHPFVTQQGDAAEVHKVKLYPREIADELDRWFKAPGQRDVSPVGAAAQTVAGTLKGLQTVGDFATTLGHLWNAAANAPGPFFKAVGRTAQAWVTPQGFREYWTSPRVQAIVKDFIDNGGHFDTSDFAEGHAGITEHIPGYGRVVKRGHLAFQAALNVAKVELYDLYKPIWQRRGGDLNSLTKYLSSMTGTSSLSQIGISPEQRALEGALWYSTRLNRASAAYLGTAFKGGVQGAFAREAIIKTAAATAAVYYGVKQLLGQSITADNLDPSNTGQFLAFDALGKHWSLGGSLYRTERLLLQTAKTAATNPSQIAQPALAYAKNSLSVPARTGLAASALLHGQPYRDFQGFPVQNIGDIARETARTVSPISGQPLIPDQRGSLVGDVVHAIGNEPPLTVAKDIGKAAATVGGEALGLRAREFTQAQQVNNIRDAVAREQGAPTYTEADIDVKHQVDADPRVQAARNAKIDEGLQKGDPFVQYQNTVRTEQQRFRQQLADLDRRLQLPQSDPNALNGNQWRQALHQAEHDHSVALQTIASDPNYADIPKTNEDWQAYFAKQGKQAAPDYQGPIAQFEQQYYDLTNQATDQHTGLVNVRKLMELRDQLINDTPGAVVDRALQDINRHKNPEYAAAQQEYQTYHDLIYQAVPKQFTPDQFDKGQEVANRVAATARASGVNDPKLRKQFAEHLIQSNVSPDDWNNYELYQYVLKSKLYRAVLQLRQRYWAQHPALAKYYSDAVNPEAPPPGSEAVAQPAA